MRIIGIDLAVKSAHKAVIADETGRCVSKVIEFALRFPIMLHEDLPLYCILSRFFCHRTEEECDQAESTKY